MKEWKLYWIFATLNLLGGTYDFVKFMMGGGWLSLFVAMLCIPMGIMGLHFAGLLRKERPFEEVVDEMLDKPLPRRWKGI